MNFYPTQSSYLNPSAFSKIQAIEEGFVDAYREQLKAEYKANKMKQAAVYYTYKNGKIFFFFDSNSLGIGSAIASWWKNLYLKTMMTLTGTKLTDEEKKELENLKIKEGADVHDVVKVVEYYAAMKKLDAIRYNKLCNTWSYLIMPVIDGPNMEKYYRRIIKKLNGVALPEKVLENPQELDKVITCKKKK